MTAPFERGAGREALSASVADMDQSYDFVPVPMESVPLWWDRVALLYKATPETWEDYDDLDHIYQQHMLGHRLLYLTLHKMELEFAISGTIQFFPTGKVVVLDWCAGRDVKKYLTLALSVLEGLARQVDAFEVKFVGRTGWQKYLSPFGYKPTHVTYTKRLEGMGPRRS